jgi:hypothetical protein
MNSFSKPQYGLKPLSKHDGQRSAIPRTPGKSEVVRWKRESGSLTKTVPPSSWASSDNLRNATGPVHIAAAPTGETRMTRTKMKFLAIGRLRQLE